MPPAVSPSLASRRERRQVKPTAPVQQKIDELQEKQERKEQAKEKSKEKALSTTRASLINQEGDKLMYKPAASFTAPTITGDDDLDCQRFDEARATYILNKLAHRGDGDWSLHYQLGEVGLPLLQEARDNPGSGVIERAIGELAIRSSNEKGKARAVSDLEPSANSSGQRSTIYSGITVGKSPADSPIKPGMFSFNLFGFYLTDCPGNTTPRLVYPSATPSAATKRQAGSYSTLPASKKARVSSPRPQKPPPPGKTTQRAVAPAPRGLKILPPETSSTKPATSLKIVTSGSQRRNSIPGSQSNKAAIEPGPRKSTELSQNPRQGSPHLSKPSPPHSAAVPRHLTPSRWAQPARKYLGQDPENDWFNDDIPQPRVTKKATSNTRPDNNPSRRQLPPTASLRDRLAARPPPTHERQPVSANSGSVVRAPINHPRAAQQQISRAPVDKSRADQRQAPKAPVEKPRADNQQGNMPPPNNPRSEQSRGKRPQDRTQSPANRRVDNARAALSSRKKHLAVAERQVPARNPRPHQPNHRDQEPLANQEAGGGNERRGNAPNDNQRDPEPCSNDKPIVRSFKGHEGRVVKLMIKKAKPWIISCGTFSWRAEDPGDEVFSVDTIVARSFAMACRERAQHFVLLSEHITCVKNLVTTYRHNVKDVVASLVERMCGFSAGHRSYNRKLVRWLLPDAFHEGLPEIRGDRAPFESHLMYAVVGGTVFGPGKMGIVHAARFSPIPIRFLAFLCSICNHVIYCYRHGAFNREEHLKSSVQEQAFQEYLALLVEMQGERPNAIELICAMMYDNCRTDAGYAPVAPADRRPRDWAPDIVRDYVPRFAVAVAENGDESGSDGNASAESGRPRHRRGSARGEERDEGEEEDRGEGSSRPYGARMNDSPGPTGWPKSRSASQNSARTNEDPPESKSVSRRGARTNGERPTLRSMSRDAMEPTDDEMSG
ncbi:hypothetical protein BDV93DRAFT_562728 [Ceratobasidium sp. AG-I]|nr:hypothetical protein BDV93DRAFT_562728 [Ceratobasidium sp. AG-I]